MAFRWWADGGPRLYAGWVVSEIGVTVCGVRACVCMRMQQTFTPNDRVCMVHIVLKLQYV